MNVAQFRNNVRPLPLVDKNLKLAIFFSAKSGSLFAVKWFFHHIGLIEKANKYHFWAHKYRTDIYYRSDDYLNSIKDYVSKNGNGYLTVKLVRNPYERAVSSYMHFLLMLRQGIRKVYSELSISRGRLNYSFEEYIGLISQIDLSNCDVHWRRQYNIYEEKIHIDRVIQLRDSEEKFKQLEEKLGLESILKSKIRSSHHHTKISVEDNVKTRAQGYVGNIDFGEEIKSVRPEYYQFYNEQTLIAISTLYSVDFSKYNFDLEYQFIE